MSHKRQVSDKYGDKISVLLAIEEIDLSCYIFYNFTLIGVLMSDQDYLIIEGSKLKSFNIFFIGIIFIAIGIFLKNSNPTWGWISIIFGALTIPVTILQLIRKPYIKLDNNGFEVYPGTKSWRLDWEDVDTFFIGKIRGNKMVGINFSRTYHEHTILRKMTSTIAGMEGAINDQYKLSPEEICEQLKLWKDKNLN